MDIWYCPILIDPECKIWYSSVVLATFFLEIFSSPSDHFYFFSTHFYFLLSANKRHLKTLNRITWKTLGTTTKTSCTLCWKKLTSKQTLSFQHDTMKTGKMSRGSDNIKLQHLSVLRSSISLYPLWLVRSSLYKTWLVT